MENKNTLERISKVIARSSQYSRRQVEGLIIEGRVKIDGKTINKPGINVSEHNKISLDNKSINFKDLDEIYLFNKPKGCLVTHSDPENRETIFDLLPKQMNKLISVGRLDFNSEGLLMLTNNGDLKRFFELPKNNFERTYRVKVQGKISDRVINQLKKGVFANGVKYKPIMANVDNSTSTYSWLTLILKEGKNREIRNIFESFNMTVTRLIRTTYGPYKLGNIQRGEFIQAKVISR